MIVPGDHSLSGERLQVGLARGLIGVVVGEMSRSRRRSWIYIAVAGSSMDVNQMFVAVVLITAAE